MLLFSGTACPHPYLPSNQHIVSILLPQTVSSSGRFMAWKTNNRTGTLLDRYESRFHRTSATISHFRNAGRFNGAWKSLESENHVSLSNPRLVGSRMLLEDVGRNTYGKPGHAVFASSPTLASLRLPTYRFLGVACARTMPLPPFDHHRSTLLGGTG